ncbi:MAG TPA: DUF6483 family protein [Chthonomonadaceae bacterium]|nr:DUF6483 family protein [Chthonomonadaceae bacterium]
MLRKGFVEIQIEMLGTMLAKILFPKSHADYAAASLAIRQASQHETGLDIFVLASLTDDSLRAQFTGSSGLDAGSCLVIGCLMQEQADICRLQGQPEREAILERKALFLLLTAMLHEARFHTPEYKERIESLLSHVAYQELAASEQHLLFRYHELQGNYARAEDVLFALRENAYPRWDEEAHAFYRHLLACPDEALIAGGLTREEVIETMAELED